MWSEITVKQYYEIMDALEEDPMTANEAIIKILFDKEMGDIPIVELKYYLNKMKFLNTNSPKTPVKEEYTINGLKFKPVLDLSKLTTAQFLDYQEFTKVGDHKHILNCLLIKDGEKYGDSDNSEFLWENMKFIDYKALLFFYPLLLENLLKDTLLSSEKMMKKMYKKEKDPMKKKELLEKIVQVRLARNEVGSQM